MTAPDVTRSLTVAPPPRRHNTNKGREFAPEIYRVEDIAALLSACTPQGAGPTAQLSADRLRAIIVILYRTGMRISELLALEESDLSHQDRAITIRRGKGGKRRIVAMDEFGWRELRAWLTVRQELPAGAIFCVLRGGSAGQELASADVRRQFRYVGRQAGLRRRFHPHGLRHACAVELWREGIDVYTIQQQLGHVRLDVTAAYLRSVAPVELLEPIGRRRAPMMLVPTV